MRVAGAHDLFPCRFTGSGIVLAFEIPRIVLVTGCPRQLMLRRISDRPRDLAARSDASQGGQHFSATTALHCRVTGRVIRV